MAIHIHQNFHIRMIKIGSVANSGVFQIGSSGIIRSNAYLYNTGDFIEPAPLPGEVGDLVTDHVTDEVTEDDPSEVQPSNVVPYTL